ncbi:MAG: hypothetical protein JXA20_05500 [Spirochaetes bacterium]|nr:hypothetical protein [Spirochaetota bacterium]
MDIEEIQEIIHPLVDAIRLISHGTTSGPAGLEGLGMAIAGDSLSLPLSHAVQQVAESMSEIAQSIDRLAAVIEDREK